MNGYTQHGYTHVFRKDSIYTNTHGRQGLGGLLCIIIHSLKEINVQTYYKPYFIYSKDWVALIRPRCPSNCLGPKRPQACQWVASKPPKTSLPWPSHPHHTEPASAGISPAQVCSPPSRGSPLSLRPASEARPPAPSCTTSPSPSPAGKERSLRSRSARLPHDLSLTAAPPTKPQPLRGAGGAGREGKGEMLLGAARFPTPTTGLGTEEEGGHCQPALGKLRPPRRSPEAAGLTGSPPSPPGIQPPPAPTPAHGRGTHPPPLNPKADSTAAPAAAATHRGGMESRPSQSHPAASVALANPASHLRYRSQSMGGGGRDRRLIGWAPEGRREACGCLSAAPTHAFPFPPERPAPAARPGAGSQPRPLGAVQSRSPPSSPQSSG